MFPWLIYSSDRRLISQFSLVAQQKGPRLRASYCHSTRQRKSDPNAAQRGERRLQLASPLSPNRNRHRTANRGHLINAHSKLNVKLLDNLIYFHSSRMIPPIMLVAKMFNLNFNRTVNSRNETTNSHLRVLRSALSCSKTLSFHRLRQCL